MPLYDLFQDDAHGNSLEVHQTYITKGFFDKYNVIEKHVIKSHDITYMNIQIASEHISKRKLVSFSDYIFHRLMRLLQPIGLAKPLVIFLKRNFLKHKWLIGRDLIETGGNKVKESAK